MVWHGCLSGSFVHTIKGLPIPALKAIPFRDAAGCSCLLLARAKHTGPRDWTGTEPRQPARGYGGADSKSLLTPNGRRRLAKGLGSGSVKRQYTSARGRSRHQPARCCQKKKPQQITRHLLQTSAQKTVTGQPHDVRKLFLPHPKRGIGCLANSATFPVDLKPRNGKGPCRYHSSRHRHVCQIFCSGQLL